MQNDFVSPHGALSSESTQAVVRPVVNYFREQHFDKVYALLDTHDADYLTWRRFLSGAAGVFPLRFGRQVEGVDSGLRAEQTEETVGIDRPRQRPLSAVRLAAHRAVGNRGGGILIRDVPRIRRNRPHHLHPLPLRDLEDAEVERLRQRHAARRLLRLVHQEAARFATLQHELRRLVLVAPTSGRNRIQVRDGIARRGRTA